MSAQQNIDIARELLDGIANGRDPAEIAAPFADDLSFEIQGTTVFCRGSVARPAAWQWSTSCGIFVT